MKSSQSLFGPLLRRGGVAAWIAFAAFTTALCVPAKHQSAPVAEVDFELVGGRIYVPGDVNGHPSSIVLDTGAEANVVGLSTANDWGLQSSGAMSVQGAGDEIVTGKFLKKAVANISGMAVSIPYAIPMDELSNVEGRPLQAIVGFTFFETHIVEVDYAKRHLRVFGPAGDFKPKGIAIPLHFDGGLPHISTAMQIGSKTFNLETMVDTGATSAALTTEFLNRHPVKVDTTPVTIVGAGLGGPTQGRLFRPASVSAGTKTLPLPVIALVASQGGVVGAKAGYDFLLGSELLRRFTVTFDYPHRRMYLDPNIDFDKPFEADKSGLRIYGEGANFRTFRVKSVLPGSSADHAGLKPNDIIDTVDGQAASRMTLQELREAFKSPTAPE